MMTSRTCDACRQWRNFDNPCPDCRGRGVRKNKGFKLKCYGINEGEMLTLRGEGEPGKDGGSYGDLYIEIRIRPHPVFTREGVQTYVKFL